MAEYTPSEADVRAWCREGTGDYPDVMDEWITRFLARVRRDAAREAETRIKAVRELHTGTHWPGVMDKPICDECDQAMPCPTTRALNGDE